MFLCGTKVTNLYVEVLNEACAYVFIIKCGLWSKEFISYDPSHDNESNFYAMKGT